MSLILDALKKVEREEAVGKPGVVVVGSVPWGEASPSWRRGPLALGAALALGLVALGGWWLLHPPALPATAERPALPNGTPSAVAASPPMEVAPSPPSANPVAPAADSQPAAGPAPAAATTPFGLQRPTAPPPVAATTSAVPAAATASGVAPRPADAAAPLPELRLAAISVRDGKPVAIVNDRLVGEGDSFDGVSVVRIGEAEVEVEFRGRRHVLRF